MVQPDLDIVLSHFAEAIGHTVLVVGAFYLGYVFMSHRIGSAGANLPSREMVRRLVLSYAVVIATVAAVAWYNQNDYVAARHPGYWIEDNCTTDENGTECDQRLMTSYEQVEAATAALEPLVHTRAYEELLSQFSSAELDARWAADPIAYANWVADELHVSVDQQRTNLVLEALLIVGIPTFAGATFGARKPLGAMIRNSSWLFSSVMKKTPHPNPLPQVGEGVSLPTSPRSGRGRAQRG